MHTVRLAVRENVLSSPEAVTAAEYCEMLESRGRGWVAVQAGGVAGFAVADRVASSIWALFVDPEHEGRGLGRQLHDRAVAWLFEQGAGEIALSTQPASRAVGFYRAAGWRDAGFEASGDIRMTLSRT